MNFALYPDSPLQKIEPEISSSFKKQTWKVLFSIAAFFLVFFILLVAVSAIAIGSFYLGALVIFIKVAWFTIALGLGIIAMGVTLFFFVVKFMFARIENDTTGLIELKREDQPKLFDFLDKLTKEISTPFPHKVYLSPEVNAAVTNNGSFLNMFLPARKNLEIGVGLINAVNISEFKAIMAHEFGHFSQKSLKITSYIYSVNRVIYNMLFENKGYIEFIQRWASINAILSVFAVITVKFTQLIQWILRGMYVYINRNYMALSREMEYNADDIAATVAGGNNLISGLKKLDSAQLAYDTSIDHANELFESKSKLKNIYKAQAINIEKGKYEQRQYRIHYKNQWASHPTHDEREMHLRNLNVEIDPVNKSAWLIFNDAERLQHEITDMLYKNVTFDVNPDLIDEAGYNDWLGKNEVKNEYPNEYNGFYDGRYITITRDDIERVMNHTTEMTFEQIFTTANGKLFREIENTKTDLNTAYNILNKLIDVKTFDFDGKKYSSKNVREVISILESDIEKLENKLKELDTQAFIYFCNGDRKQEVVTAYRRFFDLNDNIDKYKDTVESGRKALHLLVDAMTIEKANEVAETFRTIDEQLLKKIQAGEVSDELMHKLDDFRTKSYAYFSNDSFMDNEIEEFSNLLYRFDTDLRMQVYYAYRNILNVQLKK